MMEGRQERRTERGGEGNYDVLNRTFQFHVVFN